MLPFHVDNDARAGSEHFVRNLQQRYFPHRIPCGSCNPLQLPGVVHLVQLVDACKGGGDQVVHNSIPAQEPVDERQCLGEEMHVVGHDVRPALLGGRVMVNMAFAQYYRFDLEAI